MWEPSYLLVLSFRQVQPKFTSIPFEEDELCSCLRLYHYVSLYNISPTELTLFTCHYFHHSLRLPSRSNYCLTELLQLSPSSHGLPSLEYYSQQKNSKTSRLCNTKCISSTFSNVIILVYDCHACTPWHHPTDFPKCAFVQAQL